MQVKHALAEQRDLDNELSDLRNRVQALNETAPKIFETPEVGHELFKLGTLTEKVAHFQVLAAGNPRPENVFVSPLYQITVTPKREVAHAGD